jgi:hypothetical protein
MISFSYYIKSLQHIIINHTTEVLLNYYYFYIFTIPCYTLTLIDNTVYKINMIKILVGL